MKRFVVRTVWLSLILAAATAFGQAVPSTTSPAQPASSATPQPLSASLLLLKADWSKVPAAKEIESELRAALKEATVPKELLDKLPASGPQILFSPESAAIYKPEHYRELIAWLKAKDLLIDQTPFADEKGSINVVSAGNTGGIRMHEFTAKLAKPYDFLKLPPIPAAAAQPFVARTVEFQWHAGDTGDRGSSFWVERRLVVVQETRGREKPEPARPVDTCIFRWREHLPGQVVVFDTFPDGLESELAAAARRQGFVALVAVWPADQTSAGDAPAKLHLPDTVQVEIAKKGASHHWTQAYFSPLGVAPAADFSFPIAPPPLNPGTAAPSTPSPRLAPSAKSATAPATSGNFPTAPPQASPGNTAPSLNPQTAAPSSSATVGKKRTQQAVAAPSATPASPSLPPAAETTPAAEFTASLLLLNGDWSTSPEAKQIEADLRSALKDEPVNAQLLEELPKSATTILFPRQAGSVYSEERFAQFLQWLTARKVVLSTEPFWSLKRPGREDYGPSSRLIMTMTAVTLGLSAPSDGATPYFMQTAEYQWGITSQTVSGSWWIGRELYYSEQARGEKTAKRIRTNEYDRCEFTFPPLDLGQVFVVPAFPESEGRARDVNLPQRKPLALIVVKRRKAAQAATPAQPKFVLPEHVERIDARHNRGSRGGGGAWPFVWPQKATVPAADGSPPATDTFAAPPVDAKGKPVGSAARQVTDGKIIIAWSEGKDVAWGFSTSVGKWARQEINPPANGSSWPIVGGGSSAWQVGSAYYGFSGKVGQWDVVRLPDGHEPKPTVFQDFVVVNDGTAFYAFGGKTARWDVLRLPDNHKPTISFDTNYVRVSDGDDVYVFAEATGRWSSTKDAGSAANTPDNTAYKVFSLAHSRALDLERIISQILGRDVDSIAADERTNSIILRGRPEPLEVARALILRLDIEPEPEAKGVGASNSDRRNSTAPTRSAAELTKQYAAKEQQAAEIAAQLRELQAENSSNKAQVQKLTADLRRAVSEAFAARQQLHQAELAELSQRMQQIEQAVQLRSRISEQIIDRRVQDLLNPDLQWDQLAESGPRLPSKVMPAPATGSSSTSSSRPRVLVGAAFGAWADEICDALGLTVHRLKKEELQDQKLLGCLKITAISEGSPANEFQVGDIITMMQTEGISRVDMRRVTMSLLRGTERIPVTVEFPSPQQSDTPASTPRPRVMYGAAFGADADKVWNSIGIKVHLLTFDETAPEHKYLGCPKITFVDPDGPAHELQVGDLIVTLQVGSTGRDFAYATLDILRGMETFRVVVEYPSPPPTKGQSASSPTKGQSASSPTKGQSASPLRRLREPKVSVGFGSEAFRICESLGLTVQNLKKDEISDPKLISVLKISAISSDSPASELKVGDIITMMQTSGTLSGARRLTMNILRGAETFPVTVEYPAAPAAAAENDVNFSPSKPAQASTDATDTDQSANIKYGVRFGNQETKIWNTLGVKVVAVAKEELPISGYQGGAEITEVRTGSPAAGLHVGDIIVGLLNWDVTSPERLLWTLSQPISNQSGRGEFFGKHWSVETAIIYFLRDKNALQATIEFRLEPPPAAGPPPTPVNAGSAGSALPPTDLFAARAIRDKQRERWQMIEALYQGGRVEIPNVFRAAEDVGAAELAAAASPDEQRAAQQEQVERLKRVKSVVEDKYRNDVEPKQNFLAAEAALLKAEADLAAEGTGSIAAPARSAGNPATIALPSAASQPLILRSADAFRQTIYDLEDHIKRNKQNIAKSQEDLTAAQTLDQDERKKKQFSLQSAEQALAKDQAELAFVREEFASQIRLLELALQDAQSQAETAKQNARRIEQLLSNRVVSQEEAEKARQSASSAKSSVDQIVTLLDLYRKADPAKPASAAATDDKSPMPIAKPKQGEGQPR